MVTREEAVDMIADYVNVTLRIPKPVADFYKDLSDNLEERLVAELVESCCSWIDAVTPSMIAAKYPGLKETFKEYKLSTSNL